MFQINGIARRVRMDMFSKAELAIHNAIQAIEKMPPDISLTLAQTELQQTQGKVADFIDRHLEYLEAKQGTPLTEKEVIGLAPFF